MVIYPVANLIRYRIQGVSIIKYYPISGLWGILQKDFKKYGDSLRFFKQVGIEHPDAKSLAINIGGNIALYLIDPEMIKEFYSLNCYQKSPFIVKMFSRVLGNGFLFDEISHNRKRNIFSKLFHFDNLKQVVPKIEQITQNWVIQKCPLVKKTVQRIDMIDLSQHISGDIITQQFFGINMNNQRYKEKTIPQNLYHLNTATCNQMRTIRYILTGTYTFDKGWCRFDRVVNEDIKNIKQILIDALYSRINKQSQQQKQSQSQEDFQVDTENSIIDQIIKNGYILDKKSSDMSKQEKEELTKSNKILPEELLEEYLTFYLAGMETTGVLEKSQEKKQISISLMINQLLTKRFHNQIIWIASQKKYLGFMDLPLPLCIEQQLKIIRLKTQKQKKVPWLIQQFQQIFIIQRYLKTQKNSILIDGLKKIKSILMLIYPFQLEEEIAQDNIQVYLPLKLFLVLYQEILKLLSLILIIKWTDSKSLFMGHLLLYIAILKDQNKKIDLKLQIGYNKYFYTKFKQIKLTFIPAFQKINLYAKIQNIQTKKG